jgi:hypothetical protein
VSLSKKGVCFYQFPIDSDTLDNNTKALGTTLATLSTYKIYYRLSYTGKPKVKATLKDIVLADKDKIIDSNFNYKVYILSKSKRLVSRDL